MQLQSHHEIEITPRTMAYHINIWNGTRGGFVDGFEREVGEVVDSRTARLGRLALRLLGLLGLGLLVCPGPQNRGRSTHSDSSGRHP